MKDVCVVKEYVEDPDDCQSKREINIVKALREEKGRLTRRVSRIIESDGDYNWMAAEAVLGRELGNLLVTHRLNEYEVLLYHVFIQLMEGLRYLHTKRPFPICHRDLHHRNVLVDLEMENSSIPGLPDVVLIDMGLAVESNGEALAADNQEAGAKGCSPSGLGAFQKLGQWLDLFQAMRTLRKCLPPPDPKETHPPAFRAFAEKVAGFVGMGFQKHKNRKCHLVNHVWAKYCHTALKRREELMKDKDMMAALGKRLEEIRQRSRPQLMEALAKEITEMEKTLSP